MISKYINYNGNIKFDNKSPDGTFKKNLNTSRMTKLGWFPKIKLDQGLKEVIEKRKS